VKNNWWESMVDIEANDCVVGEGCQKDGGATRISVMSKLGELAMTTSKV
jgi:hypothetical protein